MSTEMLERRFAKAGARLKVQDGPWRGVPRIDVGADRRGEYFDLRFPGGEPVELTVVDASARDRHLLLLVREGEDKSKFLCGHDERHWFVAAIPEDARGVTGVVTAKAALQPTEVREALVRSRPRDRLRRRNTAYVRQGEWFFVPVAFEPPERWVLRNEPLSRGAGSKPHTLEFAYRTGGEFVYVNHANRSGITEAQYARLPERVKRKRGWTRMLSEPELHATGAVRHPDHATVTLSGWHRVLMNTERRARAMRHVVFLD